MELDRKMIDFCYCGLPVRIVNDNPFCKRHGFKCLKQEGRIKIGKYSGPTKAMKGAYENR